MLLGLGHHQATFEAHINTLDSLHNEAGLAMRGAEERLENAKNDIKSVSDTVLKAVSDGRTVPLRSKLTRNSISARFRRPHVCATSFFGPVPSFGLEAI